MINGKGCKYNTVENTLVPSASIFLMLNLDSYDHRLSISQGTPKFSLRPVEKLIAQLAKID